MPNLYGNQLLDDDQIYLKLTDTTPLNSSTFTSVAGQSVFAFDYVRGLVDVKLNGKRLKRSEYTATDGVTVTLSTPIPSNSDTLVIYGYMLEGSQNAAGNFLSYGGTANAITLTSNNAQPAKSYKDGAQYKFRATASNTGAATISVDGLPAKACRTITGAALPSGHIRTDMQSVATYYATGDRFVVVSDVGALADTNNAGAVTLATPSQAIAGTPGVIPDAEQVRKNHVAQVATIDDLRSLEPAFDGQQAELLGHTVAGIGGGPFYHDPASVAADDNGVTIVTTGGKRWVRKTDGELNPLMFGAMMDGTTNDRASITAMFSKINDGYRRFNFLNGAYFLGIIFTPSSAIFQFVAVNGLRITGMPEMRVTNSMSGSLTYESVFEFVDCSDLEVECYAVGSAYNHVSPNSNGVVAVQLLSDTVSASGARIKARCLRGLAAIQTITSWNTDNRARLPSDPTWNGIIYDAVSDDAAYGIRFIGTGDDAHGTINTNLVSRSYFVVGVHNHTARVNSRNQRDYMDILIKAYRDSVSNIHVIMNQRDSNNAEWPVCIEHQNDEDNTSITGVSIDLSIIGRTNAKVGTPEIFCVGRSLTLAGAIKTTTNCITDNISLKLLGTQDIQGAGILATPSYHNLGGRLHIDFETLLPSTSGFAIVKGSMLIAATSGDPSVNPVRIPIRNTYPVGGYFLVTFHGNKNSADSDALNSLTRQDLIRVTMNTYGNGSVANTIVVNDSRGTGFNFSYSVASGVFIVSSTVTDATSKMVVTLTPVGGRFI